MGIVSLARDIIVAGFSGRQERAEDPAWMIHQAIQDMETTLAEVRASAAHVIADQKEMRRHVVRLGQLQADWADKARLALSRDREDLARAALVEKRKAESMAGQIHTRIAILDESLRACEADIEELQARLHDAHNRRAAIATRLESAENRSKLRRLLAPERVSETMARFDALERRADDAESHADALRLGGGRAGLAGELARLENVDRVDEELEAMKRTLRTERES